MGSSLGIPSRRQTNCNNAYVLFIHDKKKNVWLSKAGPEREFLECCAAFFFFLEQRTVTLGNRPVEGNKTRPEMFSLESTSRVVHIHDIDKVPL